MDTVNSVVQTNLRMPKAQAACQSQLATSNVEIAGKSAWADFVQDLGEMFFWRIYICGCEDLSEVCRLGIRCPSPFSMACTLICAAKSPHHKERERGGGIAQSF
jgi:hypothetical protein